VPGTESEVSDPEKWSAEVHAAIRDPGRLAAVVATGMLDSAPSESLDLLARLAASVLGVPWVFVTLVDDRRSFWVSAAGVERDADGRYGQNMVHESFCQYVIGAGAAVVIANAATDVRSADNPSIASMGVQSWAGYPLRSAGGAVLGTFCAVDRMTRTWGAEDLSVLEALAGAASSQFQLSTALAAAEGVARELAAELERRAETTTSAILLAQLAQELSAATTVQQVSAVITTTGRALLGAAFANLALVDPDARHLDIVHSPPLPPEMDERYSRVSLSEWLPLSRAVTTGQPVLLSDHDDVFEQYPSLLADTVAAGLVATASVPLFLADRTTAGAIGIAWDTAYDFNPIARSLLTTVAEMCGQALDRSQVGDARTQFVRSLQYALLPVAGRRDGLDIAATYMAANNALGFGGDWYDFVHIDDCRTAVIVGDVCGHGIEAAARMTQIRGAINALVMLHADDLDHVFDHAEHQLHLDERDFIATLTINIIDTSSDTITYASAGHPPPILVSPDGVIARLEGATRPVLGFGPLPAAVRRVPFTTGCVLVAYTDGLIEQGRCPIDVGMDRLAATVHNARHGTAQAISDAIAASITQRAADDIAFTVVRRN
jgi:GAF domain-containing protein